eukprot:3102286-Pyramimonas_sp.AAC.1
MRDDSLHRLGPCDDHPTRLDNICAHLYRGVEADLLSLFSLSPNDLKRTGRGAAPMYKRTTAGGALARHQPA